MEEELARLRARVDHLQDETQKLDDVKHMLADDNQISPMITRSS